AAVIPTRSVVQTLAAAAVHDPGAHFDDDLVAMGRSVASTRYGAITVAVRQAVTTAGMCEIDDVLGLLDGDIVEIAATFEEAGRAIVRRMLDRGGELLTVVTGEGADEQLLASITAEVAEENPDVEVEIVRGGQPLWPLIIGLE
ncbi:MAG: dihydroxyacetone kinase, partial [Candidatus Nanopelagicales bacterium]